MPIVRVSLLGAPPLYAPAPARRDRISLAWWDPAEPEGRRDPVIVSASGRLRTLVVVWPTLADASIDVPRVKDGRVDVLIWDPVPAHVERLIELTRMGFPLDRHDLHVTESTAWPTGETLRTMPLGLDLERRVQAAAYRLTQPT